jgi:hypothetical protein
VTHRHTSGTAVSCACCAGACSFDNQLPSASHLYHLACRSTQQPRQQRGSLHCSGTRICPICLSSHAELRAHHEWHQPGGEADAGRAGHAERCVRAEPNMRVLPQNYKLLVDKGRSSGSPAKHGAGYRAPYEMHLEVGRISWRRMPRWAEALPTTARPGSDSHLSGAAEQGGRCSNKETPATASQILCPPWLRPPSATAKQGTIASVVHCRQPVFVFVASRESRTDRLTVLLQRVIAEPEPDGYRRGREPPLQHAPRGQHPAPGLQCCCAAPPAQLQPETCRHVDAWPAPRRSPRTSRCRTT